VSERIETRWGRDPEALLEREIRQTIRDVETYLSKHAAWADYEADRDRREGR
jgi:hypothetical protein